MLAMLGWFVRPSTGPGRTEVARFPTGSGRAEAPVAGLIQATHAGYRKRPAAAKVFFGKGLYRQNGRKKILVFPTGDLVGSVTRCFVSRHARPTRRCLRHFAIFLFLRRVTRACSSTGDLLALRASQHHDGFPTPGTWSLVTLGHAVNAAPRRRASAPSQA